jgi:type VI secretion system protein ImpH
MATNDRRESAPVRDSLIGLPSSYNFYQAVRLLVPAHDRDLTVMEGLDRAIKFETEAGDQFPASDVYSISDAANQALMTLATFGLTGPLGPIPQQHSARIESEARNGNDALKKFLGLFEHRLVSLLYLIKKKSRVGLHNGLRSQSDQYRYLFNVSGLPRKADRQVGSLGGDKVDSQYSALLPFAGLLAGGKVTVPALVNILSTLLNTKVSISSGVGAFIPLDPSVQARLASTPKKIYAANLPQRLGEKRSLGGRIWNQSYAIEIEIGPVDWETANSWVPGNDAYAKLVDLLLYTTNGQWQLETVIKVHNSTIPVSRLDCKTRLGFNSWIKTTEGNEAISSTRRTIKPTHFH